MLTCLQTDRQTGQQTNRELQKGSKGQENNHYYPYSCFLFSYMLKGDIYQLFSSSIPLVVADIITKTQVLQTPHDKQLPHGP